MHKLVSYTLILLILIGTVSILGLAYGNSYQNDLHEQLDIYTYGTVTLLDLKIYNHPTITDNFNKVFDFTNESITVCYSNIPKWYSEFNYLLSGVIFNDTYLKEIPYNGLVIEIPSSTFPNDLVENFNELFKTYFFTGEGYLIGRTDYSIFLSVFNDMISLPKYTRFLSWMDPTNFSPDVDPFIIIFSRDGSNSLLRIIMVKNMKTKYFYWSLDKFVSYKASTPYIGYNYTSTLNMYFKDVFIENKPENMTIVKEDNKDQYYIYRLEVNSTEDFMNPRLKIRYETPALIVTRSFNSTVFYYGEDIEVRLSVKNLMTYPIHSINLSECTWWTGVGKLIKGDTTIFIDNLKADSEYTLSYVIRIDTQNQTEIAIGPAEAIMVSETGLKEILYSNTNIIYLNIDNPPFLSANIISLDARDLAVGRAVNYVAEISNEGNSTVHSVIFGEYIIGDLKPGDSRKIESKKEIKTIGGHHLDIYMKASYLFQDIEYNLSTQLLPLDLYPRIYNRPWIDVEYETELDNNTLSMSIKLSNNGLFDVQDITVRIKPYDSFYREGDFDSNLTYFKDVLPANSTLDLNATFSYSTDTISLYPRIFITFSGFYYNISSDIDYFYNTISAKLDMPEQPYLMGRNYTFSMTLNNNGFAKLYNLSISFPSTGFIISPGSMNYSVINPLSNKVFSFTLYSNTTGNFTFPAVKYNYWYLGSLREDEIKVGNISFYRGLWAEYKAPESVDEGGDFSVNIIIYTDSIKYVDNVSLDIVLPEGLIFTDGVNEKTIPVSVTSRRNEVVLNIRAVNPGRYKLEDARIRYEFNGLESEYDIKGENLPTITVKENLLKRYWMYFLPMLAVVLIYAYYLRKKIV